MTGNGSAKLAGAYARKRFLIVIVVKPQISFAQASRLLNRGRLGDEKTRAGQREMTEARDVPVGALPFSAVYWPSGETAIRLTNSRSRILK
jgi:hypothetical protein